MDARLVLQGSKEALKIQLGRPFLTTQWAMDPSVRSEDWYRTLVLAPLLGSTATAPDSIWLERSTRVWHRNEDVRRLPEANQSRVLAREPTIVRSVARDGAQLGL